VKKRTVAGRWSYAFTAYSMKNTACSTAPRTGVGKRFVVDPADAVKVDVTFRLAPVERTGRVVTKRVLLATGGHIPDCGPVMHPEYKALAGSVITYSFRGDVNYWIGTNPGCWTINHGCSGKHGTTI